ncbi:MAG: HAMP domain-containing protein [Oscillospiraceae bacterium]|nr:HAMP domain-containing protein [Oscillospiraceae bacterium]
MKNMKIKARMIIALGIVMLLSVITLAFSLMGSAVSGGKYNDVIHHDMAASQYLLSTRIYTNTAARYLRDMALQDYSTEMDSLIQEQMNNLDQTMKTFIEYYPLSDGKASAYQTAVAAWQTTAQEIIDDLKSGNQTQARMLLQQSCTPTLNSLTTQATELSSIMATSVDSTVLEAQQLSSGILFASIVLMIIALVLTLILSTKLVRDITRPLTEAQAAIIHMSQGDLTYETKYESTNEIGQMTEAIRTSQKVLHNVIQDISDITAEMAAGNFDVHFNTEFPGDLAPIRDSVQQLVAQMNETLARITEAAHSVSAGADQVSSGAQTLAQGATEQASAVEELSATLTTLSQGANSNSEAATKAQHETADAGNHVDVCTQYMEEMVAAMDNISRSSEEISKIIATIENIAFQTNILALNAAVEAARAGTAGKGFAVVADEVRNLASKSDEAAKATKELIEESVSAVQNGGQIVTKVSEALTKTNKLTEQAVAHVSQISELMKEELTSIEQVSEGLDQISAVIQTNSATSQESAAASQELSSQSSMMRQLMSTFKLQLM